MKRKYSKMFFVFILLFCISCGKKEWPKPIKKEDMFSFSKIYAKYKGNCLEIKGEILGNVRNLKQIVLEMETSKDVCKKCPFSPDVKITYIPTQNPKKQKGSLINQRFFKFLSPNSFVLTHCRDTGHNVSRLRLVGVNRFSELRYVYSKIIRDIKNK